MRSGLTANGRENRGRRGGGSGSWRCGGEGLLKRGWSALRSFFQSGIQKTLIRLTYHNKSTPDTAEYRILWIRKLTGAIVRLATTAASGTFENVLVVVAVVFVTWTKAVAITFSPPPEQVLNPK